MSWFITAPSPYVSGYKTHVGLCRKSAADKKAVATMHPHTPTLQLPSISFHPLCYPHNLTAQPYYSRYMSRLYYSEPRYYDSYYDAPCPPSSKPLGPVQTVAWTTHITLVQPPQHDGTPRNNHLKSTASKHVHFDLPTSPKTTRNNMRTTREPRPQETSPPRPRRQEKESPRLPLPLPMPSPPGRDQPHHYSPRPQYPSIPPTPKPTQPTIYIITYSADLIRSESTTTALLASQVPRRHPPIPHLYTIDARNMRPPPPALCDRYSGVSPAVQDAVMQDAGARTAVETAVRELLRFGDEQRCRARDVPRLEVSLSVCCHAGTHRSVAIAERIAQCVKREVGRSGCREGVRVVCRHVHRVRGWADPF